MARFRSILVKVKGEGGILVLRLRRKITITSRWSWRLKFWESEQLLKPERATGVPGVDFVVKSSMTYPSVHYPNIQAGSVAGRHGMKKNSHGYWMVLQEWP